MGEGPVTVSAGSMPIVKYQHRYYPKYMYRAVERLHVEKRRNTHLSLILPVFMRVHPILDQHATTKCYMFIPGKVYAHTGDA